MRRPCNRGFTLIELMIIIALLGVMTVNIAELMPTAWKAFFKIARDHAAIEAQVRLHAHLAKDLETGTPRSDTPRSLVLSMPGGGTVRYVTEAVPSRVRREAAGQVLTFADARLAVLTPGVTGGAWNVRIESTVTQRRPPAVIVSAWPREVK